MQTLLEIGLANAVMASALALLAALAGLFCRCPALRHTLWLLVLLKLITPPFLPVPVRCSSPLLALLPNQAADSSPHESSEVRSADFHHGAVADIANQTEEEGILELPDPSSPALGTFPSSIPNSEWWLTATYLLDWTVQNSSGILFTVWLAGAALWFSAALTRIYRFQRLLRYGRAAPAHLQDQAKLLAGRLGLAHCPTVWLVPGRVSPLLWSLGRRLYLVVPAGLLDRLEPAQRDSMLAHELAHALRRDHWVRWLEFTVSSLYWWLPVAWWARREIQQAEEECCDAWVVWTLPTVAKAYAKALLLTVDFLDARPALPPVASGIGHVPLLKRRLTMIVRQPLCPQLSWPVHLGVILLGLLVLPLAPQRLAAQNAGGKPVPELADGTALVQAEQDPADRDVERRLRALEEKMDKLMRTLKTELGKRYESEKPDELEMKLFSDEDMSSAKEKAKRALEKFRAAVAQKIEPKQLAEILNKEIKQRIKAEKELDPAQIRGIIDAMLGKYQKQLEPEVKDLQKRIQEAMNKNLNPQRTEEIQRKVEEALKRSRQQMDEALKRSIQQLEKAQTRIREAERARANEPKSAKIGGQEQRELERRMERLEQKMDHVLQALEKSGKSSRQAF